MKNERNIPIVKNEKIPSIDFYISAFEKLRSQNFSNYKEAMDFHTSLFKTYPVLPLIHSIDNSRFKAYRAISENEIKLLGLNPNLVNTFSYPPDNVATQQRFNMANSPVFYCSSLEHTCITEKISQNSTDILYISTWKLVSSQPHFYISLFYRPTSSSFSEMTKVHKKKLKELFAIYSEDKQASLQYYIEQLTILSQQEHFNVFTSALGNYYFYDFGKKIDPSIMYMEYPSTKQTEGVNYAVNRQFIDNGSIICSEIRKVEITKYSETQSHCKILKNGIVDGINIIWQEVTSFDCRINSTSFFNSEGSMFISLSNQDLELNFLKTDFEKVSIKDFIYKEINPYILSDGSNFKLNQKLPCEKMYRLNYGYDLMIGNTKCSVIEVSVSFK